MTEAPDDTLPTLVCVCTCNTTHPPAARDRCTSAPVVHRSLRAPGVGLVALPVCQACNARWAELGLGAIHSDT